MNNFLKTPIEYLKGVGPQRAELLQKELGIFTFGDLLEYYPFRYVDRTKIHKSSELTADMPYVQLKGELRNIEVLGPPRKQRMSARFVDDSGSVDLVWFRGVKYLQSLLKPNTTYILFGKPTVFNRSLNIAHPELEEPHTVTAMPQFQPVYPNTELLRNRKMDNKVYRKLLATMIAHPEFKVDEYLPKEVKDKYKLIDHELAYKWIHNPSNHDEMNHALRRLKFDEFFVLQLSIMRLKKQRGVYKGIVFGKVGEHFNNYFNTQLSFELTDAQKRVIKEIRIDMGSGKQMNRLLQGDVGSGKSIVAILSILIAIDNGYQAALMAPTEILATQHYEGFKESLAEIGVEARLLTGSTKAKERKAILAGVAAGEVHVLIGTHALIEDRVQFKKQGLVVIDEQHRFGVAQRAKLWQKADYPPHVLVMTATPIPRTLAMTVYGDLDVSKIDELPSGRKQIKTAHRTEAKRLEIIGFIKKEIAAGRQVYVVYPLIEESETLDYKNLNEGYDHLLHFFPRPEYQVDMLHGRMKPDEKDAVMKRFKDGQSHILVSTTVIEVGVNVPNATVMIIESSEKFGLAQLHQLRGRVGRGSEQSYCILMTGNKLTSVARERLAAMVSTTDGFEIAEFDLKLRGPGDIEGTRQSGLLDLKLASITKDEDLLGAARFAAIDILQEDPELTLGKHAGIRQYMREKKGFVDWSRVS